MALQTDPYQLNQPTAYHRVAQACRFAAQVDGEVQEDAALVSVTMNVYADRDARYAGDDPIQTLHFEFAAPADTSNLVHAAYLDAKTRPIWCDAVDV